MKFCKNHALDVVASYESKFIMKFDDNGEPCQRPLSPRESCGQPSRYTVIIPNTLSNIGKERREK